VSFLLDTNAISESARPRPDPGVMEWLASVDEEQLFLSIVTVAELRHGIERLDEGRRKAALDVWLTEQLPYRFNDRLLHADADTADHWGRIVAHADDIGRPIGAMDAFIAALAVQHDLTLVTRNTKDFATTGVRLFNPWLQGEDV
jgi:predicted nucleic acid-binding protein